MSHRVELRPQVLDDLAVSLDRVASVDAVAIDERRAAILEAIELRERLVAAQPQSRRAAQRLATAKRIAALLNDNPASPDDAAE